MQGKVRNVNDQEQSFLASQNIAGTVEISLPHIGKALVRTNAAQSPCYIVCQLPVTGGQYGITTVSAPLPGTQVEVHTDRHSLKSYILNSHAAGTQGQGIQQLSLVYTDPTYLTQSDMSFTQKLTQILQEEGNQAVISSPCGITQDTYPGDYISVQQEGPLVFHGRAQITVKGSDLAYTQFSAIGNKITTVAHKFQLDTANTKQTSQEPVNKYLVASSLKQSLGVLQNASYHPIISTQASQAPQLQLNPECQAPIYRYQRIQGGIASGAHQTVVAPINSQADVDGQYSVAASKSVYNNGSLYQTSRANIRSIKTPIISALQQIGLETAPQTQHQQAPQVDCNSQDRALMLDHLLKASSQLLLTSQISKDNRQALQKYSVGYKAALDGRDPIDWQTVQQSQIQDTLPDLPSAYVQDILDGSKRRIFKATSFITQQDDGSVLIKDGWGSQIRMTKGNIYISSALDTFIRPGRNLIGMTPGLMQLDSNQGVVISSKQDIKLASQMSVNVASAISGGQGYTVLQSRGTNLQTNGVVVRSNGDMSITASKDMVVALNDKTSVNAGGDITKGSGNILIEGGRISLHGSQTVQVAGSNLGLYGKAGSSGAGIQINSAGATVTGPVLSVNTSLVHVNRKSTNKTVYPGSKQDDKFSVRSGSGSVSVVVSGSVATKSINVQGGLNVSSSIVASQYGCLTEDIQIIPKIRNSNKVRNSINESHDITVSGAEIPSQKPGISWYNDQYLCQKQTSFIDSQQLHLPRSGKYFVPTMCWQVNPVQQEMVYLEPIVAYSTGQKEVSYSFPGKQAWSNGSMSVVEQTQNKYFVQQSAPLYNGYATNTKRKDK